MFKRTACAAALLACAAVAQAQQPKKHPYEITPGDGAWAINVACFVENIDQPEDQRDLPRLLAQSRARRLAIDLVTLLRAEYKLQAFMFNRGDSERKKEEERIAAQWKHLHDTYREKGIPEPPELSSGEKKERLKRYAHIQDQYVVLLGGYADQETAHKALPSIRKLELGDDKVFEQVRGRVAKQVPGFMQGERNFDCFRTQLFAAWEPGQGQRGRAQASNTDCFKSAMVVPNPTAPPPKAPTAEIDTAEVLAKLNADNPYSPLKHAGKWTLVVKMYRAPAPILETGDNRKTGAADPAKMFNVMTKQSELFAGVLRNPQLNFDAYVLHTNYASLVTVGVFDSEQDKRLAAMQSRFATLKLETRGVGATQEELLNPPLPIPIPKAK